MYAGYETATVEFDGRTVVVDLVSVGGLAGDWKARSEEDKDFVRGLIGFERTLSRAIDSDNGIGEYKSIRVTLA